MPIIHRPLAFGLALVTVYVGVSGSREQELVTAGLRVPERQRLELVFATHGELICAGPGEDWSLGLIPSAKASSMSRCNCGRTRGCRLCWSCLFLRASSELRCTTAFLAVMR